MSRNIKTVKCLMKHIGETVHVISKEGFSFNANVILVKNDEREFPRLKTEDSIADKDCRWWSEDWKGNFFCHDCAFDYQITKELKSLTLVTSKKSKEKPQKKTTEYLTKDELDAARGHFCLLKDGSKGFICTKTESEEKPMRVLHNYSDAIGWNYTEREMSEDDSPETIKHDFTRAYNVWSESDAAALKVVEILEKYDGRKHRYKKAKEESPKTVEAPKAKEVKKFLNTEQITDGVGHFCIMADGSEGYITRTKSGNPLVIHNADEDCAGWRFDPEDYASTIEDKELCKKYRRGWWINHDSDARSVKIVKILDTQPEEKCAESTKKSVLDLTVRELLEKLDEIIKR